MTEPQEAAARQVSNRIRRRWMRRTSAREIKRLYGVALPRQRWSPESKPVHIPHAETGREIEDHDGNVVPNLPSSTKIV